MLVLALPAPAAFAQPHININYSGSNSINISVSGAPFGQPIELAYILPGSSLPTVISNIGNAYSGNWSGTLNLNEYGIVSGSQVYVRVGGDQSNVITVGGYTSGCTYNCGSPYGLSLSQNNVYLTVGQSQAVTIYNNNYYISSNSNPSVVSANISGNQVNLYGLMNGSSTISVCSSASGYGCASIYVSVSGSVLGASTYNVSIRDNYFSPQTITIPAGSSITWRNDGSMSHTVTFDNPYSDSGIIYSGSTYTKIFSTSGTYTYHCRVHPGMTATVIVTGSGSGTGNVWFNPSNPTMYTGQSLAVSINSSVSASSYAYPTDAYYISANSNSSVVSANISGTALNLYANQTGSSNITVCHSSLNFCGTLLVTVLGGYASGQLTFSQANVNLNQGQNININIYGGAPGGGTYYISNNNNPNVVTASIAGNTVYLYGQSSGSAAITVCQNNAAACGMVYVTVFGSTGGTGGIWFSQGSLNLVLNQSQTVSIYSSLGANYYLSSNSNSGAVTASVVGNSLNIYGRAVGSSNVVVCHSTATNSCGTIFVSVGAGFGSGSLTLSQTSLNLAAGQSAAITVYNSTGSLYISTNSNPSVAGAGISGSTLNVYAANPGLTNISVCQNNASGCVTLPVTVSGYSSGSLTFITASLPTLTLGQFYSYALQVSGGTPPYNFSLVSGSLPSGLSLSTSGVITGTVASAAASSFTVRVSDNFGRTTTANFYLAGPSGSGSGSLSGGVLGASTYKNGQLLREGNTIYLVYRNLKSGFASLSAFAGFGFKLSNVINVGSSGLNDSGFVVSASNASHPWGSWVKSGQTVYFVHETGLISVPDWNTFINNGGQGQLIVNANLKDFALPMLSPMVLDDARLR